MRRMSVKFAAPTHVDAVRLESWQPYWEDDTLSIARPRMAPSTDSKDVASALWIENLPCFEHLRLQRWSRQKTDTDSAKRFLSRQSRCLRLYTGTVQQMSNL